MEKEENDNKRTDLVDESANGLDSVEVRGGQNGRNSRGIGSNDMDAKNGVLRLGDQDDSSMQVTEEGAKAATASNLQTNTGTADVTTAGPDDYASANDADADVSQEEVEEDVSQTGTSTEHQPTY
jgi:hypothetical protein